MANDVVTKDVVMHGDVFDVERTNTDDCYEVAIATNWRLPKCTPLAWRRADMRVCADGGANRLFDEYFRDTNDVPLPELICGDLDSIREDVRAFFAARGTKVNDMSDDQDTTDLQKCLKVAKEHFSALRDVHRKSSLRVVALGALGGRLDHTLYNVNVLYLTDGAAGHANFPMELVYVGENSTARVLRGPRRDGGWVEHSIPVDTTHEGPTCGLCALADVTSGHEGVRAVTEGLRWNLDGTRQMAMGFGALQSTSNAFDKTLIDDRGRCRVRVRCNGTLLWTTELKR